RKFGSSAVAPGIEGCRRGPPMPLAGRGPRGRAKGRRSATSRGGGSQPGALARSPPPAPRCSGAAPADGSGRGRPARGTRSIGAFNSTWSSPVPDTASISTRYLQNLWDPGEAEKRASDPLELLRYRSNLLGADLRITNFGGGNTSSKFTLPDPLTGQAVR